MLPFRLELEAEPKAAQSQTRRRGRCHVRQLREGLEDAIHVADRGIEIQLDEAARDSSHERRQASHEARHALDESKRYSSDEVAMPKSYAIRYRLDEAVRLTSGEDEIQRSGEAMKQRSCGAVRQSEGVVRQRLDEVVKQRLNEVVKQRLDEVVKQRLDEVATQASDGADKDSSDTEAKRRAHEATKNGAHGVAASRSDESARHGSDEVTRFQFSSRPHERFTPSDISEAEDTQFLPSREATLQPAFSSNIETRERAEPAAEERVSPHNSSSNSSGHRALHNLPRGVHAEHDMGASSFDLEESAARDFERRVTDSKTSATNATAVRLGTRSCDSKGEQKARPSSTAPKNARKRIISSSSTPAHRVSIAMAQASAVVAARAASASVQAEVKQLRRELKTAREELRRNSAERQREKSLVDKYAGMVNRLQATQAQVHERSEERHAQAQEARYQAEQQLKELETELSRQTALACKEQEQRRQVSFVSLHQYSCLNRFDQPLDNVPDSTSSTPH